MVGESNLYSDRYEEYSRSYYGDDCSEDGDILATQSQVWYDSWGRRRVGENKSKSRMQIGYKRTIKMD